MKTVGEKERIERFCELYTEALAVLGYDITLKYNNDREKIIALAFEGLPYEQSHTINVGASSTTAVARDVCNQIEEFLRVIA